MKTQNEWLSRELQARSEELFQLRKERATIVGGLEGRLASSDQEVCVCVCDGGRSILTILYVNSVNLSKLLVFPYLEYDYIF